MRRRPQGMKEDQRKEGREREMARENEARGRKESAEGKKEKSEAARSRGAHRCLSIMHLKMLVLSQQHNASSVYLSVPSLHPFSINTPFATSTRSSIGSSGTAPLVPLLLPLPIRHPPAFSSSPRRRPDFPACQPTVVGSPEAPVGQSSVDNRFGRSLSPGLPSF